MSALPAPPEYFVSRLRDLHLRLRDHLREQLHRSSTLDLSAVADTRGGDTQYEIDERGETILLDFCRDWSREMPFLLVAEGLPDGTLSLPEGGNAAPRFRLIVDPIDGTRVIMYDKRSAWILSAVAPEGEEAPSGALGARSAGLGVGTRGDGGSNPVLNSALRAPRSERAAGAPTLTDVVVAVQTEVPTTRQYLGDLLYAWNGGGARGERHNLLTGEWQPFTPAPSRAESLAHGFATISKFYLGGKELTARLEEALFERLLGPPEDGNPLVFDDQYCSSGGQLYELMIGHDRFNADLRPLTLAKTYVPGQARRLCAHPYDLCTELIAREAGVIVTDERGQPLDAPLDVHADIAWIGYANATIRSQVEPVLLRLLEGLKM